MLKLCCRRVFFKIISNYPVAERSVRARVRERDRQQSREQNIERAESINYKYL